MKKTTVFTLAAVCGAFALALPDWKKPLNATYPNEQYKLVNAELTQTLAVSGCKTLSIKKTKTGPSTFNTVALFDNGSYALYRYATGDFSGIPDTIVTGSWSKVPGKSSDTFYLSINSASMDGLLDDLDDAGLANCKTNPKLASMTQLDFLAPTALVKKNTLVFNIKKKTATGTLQITGQQHNDQKGSLNAVGKFSVKATLKGGVWMDCSEVSCT
ncbi:MAG TPA: hypothetical protein PK244_04360 [Pseudomonadales bacterium]|nr:hypothetical protein [Pseudomonadales bacterium]HRG50115.1 hypothetical protein [Pseudomonadales bacterium]